MNFRFFSRAIVCGLAALAFFASCSDDDTPSWKEGSTVNLPSYRAFVLSEGSYGSNNSHLVFLNPEKDTIYTHDIFEAQNNGLKIGDTAQGMIDYNGDIYYVVNGSGYIVRLNGSGVMQSRYAFGDELGQPRYMTAKDGKVYVTSYGGYVSRFDARTLELEASVKVDANPEQIVEKDGKLYCVNSGYGMGNTMSVIDVNAFDKAESVTIVQDPFALQEDNGFFYVMGYDQNWTSWVYAYDPATQNCRQIAQAGRMLADGGKLFFSNSVASADWTSYDTSFYIYDPQTGKVGNWVLSGAPETLYKSVVYMIVREPRYQGFYIATTDYYTNGTLYHFDKNGRFLNQVSAGGVNPNSMIFLY